MSQSKRDINDLTNEQKRELVAEYEHLPHGGRGQWITERGYTLSQFWTMRGILLKSWKRLQKSPQSSAAFLDLDEQGRRELLKEYYQLPTSEKAAWRESHGLSQSSINFHGRALRIQPRVNGKPSTALVHQPRPPVPVRLEVNQATAKPRPIPQPLSFHDAINVIRVKRDMYDKIYNEILTDLERMTR